MKSYIQVDVQKKSIASFSFHVNFSRHLPLIRTLDLEVQASIVACRVVSKDKELYSTFSLFTQVDKWVPRHTAGG